MLQGDDDGFCATGGKEFGENVADVKFYGGSADDKGFGNFVIVKALDHEIENLALALGEVMADLRDIVVGGGVD